MNTTTLRPGTVLGSPVSGTSSAALHVMRSAARDFVMGLLGITKGGLLSQQAERPRLRRF